jgi:hypothetical protein
MYPNSLNFKKIFSPFAVNNINETKDEVLGKEKNSIKNSSDFNCSATIWRTKSPVGIQN